MDNYHTAALKTADIFTVMGSIYAEVARYDSAIATGHKDQAQQAARRAEELIAFSQKLDQISAPQKLEIKKFSTIFSSKVKEYKKSELDNYLLPFAVSARARQFK